MTKLPAITQRTRDGKAFGAFRMYIRNKSINLQTDDYELAQKRRREALRGARKWPRVFAQKVRASAPEGTAVVDALAALGDLAPDEVLPQNGKGIGGGGQPLLLAPIPPEHAPTAAQTGDAPPAPPSEPVIEPERIDPEPPGAWAADLGATDGGGSSSAPPSADAVDLLPLIEGGIVFASKIAVQLQVTGQAKLGEMIFKVPFPRLTEGDRAPQSPEEMAQYLAQQLEPWPAGDPREQGRKAYEKLIRKLIPSVELPEWVAAPLLVAIATLPVQAIGAIQMAAAARAQRQQADAAGIPSTEGAPDASAA